MPGQHFYPAFLDLRGRRVLVVGGGGIAARKARALTLCGAKVALVAPRVTPSARRYAHTVAVRRFRVADLAGAAIVVSAADDEKVNERVSALCRARGLWANVVDRPRLCDFIVPAVARRGRIAVAVSTGGACPGLARALRQRLERRFLRREDAALAERLARRRPALRGLSMAQRRRALRAELEAAAR